MKGVALNGGRITWKSAPVCFIALYAFPAEKWIIRLTTRRSLSKDKNLVLGSAIRVLGMKL